MKRNVYAAVAVILGAMMLGACGTGNGNGNAEGVSKEGENQGGQKLENEAAKEQEPAEEQGAAGQQTEEAEAAGNIYVEMEESVMEFKAEDGTVVLKVDRTMPVITISAHEESAAAMNEYMNNMFPEYDEEMLEAAKETYADLGKENWHEFASGTAFFSERTDSEVISFTITSYWDMGGAHPNSVRSGLNFRTADGKRLTLEDVTVDKEAATAAINEFLLAETKKKEEEYEGMFFEGYEESIADILTEDSWYLGEDGFHIIVNEYIISPHAAGILDFAVPYAEAGFLKEEFRK